MLKVLISLLVVLAVTGRKIKYDQSQTGDYNVHLDLKNIEIVALLDDSSFTQNEYEYDYGEMTLKPSSTPETSNQTRPVKPSTPTSDEASNSTQSSSAKPNRRCAPGFFRDANGRCRRARQPTMRLDGLLERAKNMFTRNTKP